MRSVSTGIRKKDAMALVTGQPVYTDDLVPPDCLVVKVVRSPHAHALIEGINKEAALKVPGIVCILTYEDVPGERFTIAGQTYPEFSPYDRLILDRRLRYAGDAAAIIAGKDEKAVIKAMKLLKIQYQILEPILDLRKAKDSKVIIHPEDNWKALVEVGGDPDRNLVASEAEVMGDVEGVLGGCDYTVEQTYHTKANQQAMMETFRTYTYLDTYGRLNVVSSTQVPFHVRRILANGLQIPKSRIRVIKPRIGGGFGAKQTAVSEVYPALVTLKTGKPAKIIYTREESQIASSPRHEMEVKVKIGADKDGIIKAIDVYALSNTGAFGDHGPTTVGLTGHKTIPLYAKAEAYRFAYDVVYTNHMAAGAYRGYGATQGVFAVESAVNELAHKMGMDPTKIRELNMVHEGDVMPAYYGETLNSCALDKCMATAKRMMNWDEKYPARDMGNHKVRGVGVAMNMQGSGISFVDTAAVSMKVNDDGFYSLMIGAADMGTGCDTTLAQIAAECLVCETNDIIISGVDTDSSPYDSGSYASSTAYITGMAVVKTCESLIKRIREEGAKALGCTYDQTEFQGDRVKNIEKQEEIALIDLANQAMCGNENALFATESHSSAISPPPFMVGMAEVEVDIETGAVELLDYVGVVDCGTPLNPNLCRVQTEGGLAQGIGMALYEDVVYSEEGKNYSNSFLQYKIPTRLDVGEIRVALECSYEKSGPFGAKSIGEVVISTPPPAIAAAVHNAVGVWIRELPVTGEKVYMKMQEK